MMYYSSSCIHVEFNLFISFAQPVCGKRAVCADVRTLASIVALY